MPFGTAAYLLLRSQRLEGARATADSWSLRIPVWVSPQGLYIICTNPRSGSWLLSDGLASTRVAGNPREWFNVMEEQQHRARWRMDHASDLNYATYLRIARARSTTPNGISGIKVHYYQLAELHKRVEAVEGIRGLTDSQLMSRLFPRARYLWLRRRDKARQAISLLIASSTDEWWAIDGAAPETRDGDRREPEFDAHAIARVDSALARNDSKWRSYFEDNRIEPFVVHYEDLAADHPGVMQSVLKWLGVPIPDSIGAPPRLRRQSTARNEEWLTRYLAFKAAGGDPAQSSAQNSGSLGTESVRKPFNRIPDAWKAWVAQAKLRNTKDEDIVAVLVKNGYNRASALAEVKGASS